MRITITAGTGTCKHITVRNAANNAVIGVFNRDDVKDAWQDWTSGDLPFNFLTLACYMINRARRLGEITAPLTMAKAKNYLESVEL